MCQMRLLIGTVSQVSGADHGSLVYWIGGSLGVW